MIKEHNKRIEKNIFLKKSWALISFDSMFNLFISSSICFFLSSFLVQEL
jgi:hypothetical protein